jgi:hypothetical protein
VRAGPIGVHQLSFSSRTGPPRLAERAVKSLLVIIWSVVLHFSLAMPEVVAVAAAPTPVAIPALPAAAPPPETRGSPDAEVRVGPAPRAGASSPVIVAAPLPPLEPSRAAAGDAAAAARDYFVRMGAIQTFASTKTRLGLAQ